MFLKSIGAISLILMTAAAIARASSPSDPETPSPEVCSSAGRVTIFDSDGGLLDLADLRGSEDLSLRGAHDDLPDAAILNLLPEPPSYVPAPRSSRKRIALSILGSAILPGLGELYLYLESRDNSVLARVPVFFALEGYLWYGYNHNHDKGKDIKREYMDYADAHWSLERFLTQHPCCAGYGGCDDWRFYNESCPDDYSYIFFPYTAVEDDEEEYYENIGKYNAFVFGWDDWAGQFDYWTPNRKYYWSLRDESDKYLVRADNHLMFLIVSRVISMLDAGWLAYKMSKGEVEDEGLSLSFESRPSAPMVAVRYRF
jgi:hypothetical protein